jgi:4-hydroxy-2-oxoheptanedioate aldolase
LDRGIDRKEKDMAATLRNAARERLDRDELALGIILRQARTVDIAPIMKAAGFDWLFLDLEHNSMDLDTAVQIAVAALGAGVAPIARVPARQLWMATRFLDGGGLGIVMPHVDTPEQAREIADHLKYPPMGHRSVAGGQAIFDFKPMKIAELIAESNAATLVVVMLETPTAIANADKIAAVPGIDVLLIGTNDLAAEMGIPGEFGHERIAAAYETVIAACRKNGKWSGMGGVYNQPLLGKYVGMGIQMVLAGNDVGFLMAAGQARAVEMREVARGH